MKLTKKYRIVYKNKTIHNSGEYTDGSVTLVGNGKSGVEFDTEQEMNDYIKSNNLKYNDEDYMIT
jgi:hypothetical protein